MKKHLTLFPTCIAIAIFFYPTTSNSNSSGSPGEKTGSPNDVLDCRGCHSNAPTGQGATITTNIPLNGYLPGSTYTITVAINIGASQQDPKGFEFTCEDDANNMKAGTFIITNPTNTKLTNNGKAVTHTSNGNNTASWSFDWVAPNAGTGSLTFYGAFIEASYPFSNNQGDIFNSNTLSFNESITNDINHMYEQDEFTYNSFNTTIESQKTISIYNISGKLVLTTRNNLINISHLNKGIYIIKASKKSQMIILN